MRSLWLALCLAILGIAPAQAQNFSMPPPAGVVVGGFAVVTSCAGQSLLTTKPAFGTMDTTGAICVNATVSASVTGFTPNGNFATLTSTASSADAALPAGVTVELQNTGTTAVSCNLTVGAGTSAASKLVIQAGSTGAFVVGSNTHYSCINQAGDSASNVVVAAGGAGLAVSFGGGGGGAGGAVTVASGADVAEGAIGDAAWVSGNATLISLGKAIATNTGAAIPAGTLSIGTLNPFAETAAASGVLKASSGNLFTVSADAVTATTDLKLLLFNSATLPADGAVTPYKCISFKGDGTQASLTLSWAPNALAFSTGMSAAVSSATACTTKTTTGLTPTISGQVQ